MLSITIQLNISARLIPQVTTIIYHLPSHEKSIIKKGKKKENTKIWGLDQNSHVKKNDT